jgi:hypothetical protein
MIIIWGQRNYGKVDQVPGFCYVATKFFHLWFIPLIPLQSWIVLAGTEHENGFRGVPIGIRFKSLLLGWARAAMILAVPVMTVLAFLHTAEALNEVRGYNLLNAGLMWVSIPALIAVTWLSYRLSRASLRRAMQLADQLGVSRVAVARLIHPDRTDEELATQVEEPVAA